MCMCEATGLSAQSKRPEDFCASNLHRLALIPTANFSPACLSVCAAQAYNGRTRLGAFSCSLCHQKSQRYPPLTASLLPKAFFFSKCKRLLLSPSFLWMHTENLLPDLKKKKKHFQECSEKFELNHACFSLLEILQEQAVIVALVSYPSLRSIFLVIRAFLKEALMDIWSKFMKLNQLYF